MSGTFHNTDAPVDAMRTASPLAPGIRLSLIGLIVNLLLVAGKFAAGVLGNSYALIADAAESSLDIFSSFVVWRGLRIASRPADEDHPYGHGRAEAVAGMIVSLMLLFAGVGIAVGAVGEMSRPHPAPAMFTLAVLLGVVVVKEIMYRATNRIGRRVHSGAISADAWHHRSDAITSAAAAIGITIAILGGQKFAVADEIAALFASVIIVINAWLLSRQPLSELMDRQPREVVANAHDVAAGVPGVTGVDKVLARKSGITYLVDMHVEVSPDMTVRKAHAVAHDVRDAICTAMPNVQDVLVHVEPQGEGGVRE